MTTYPHRSRTPVVRPVPVPGPPPVGPAAVHVLENAVWRVGVAPGTGGSVVLGQVQDRGTWRDLLRPTPSGMHHSVEHCASFLMLPWSNRVGRASLDHAGRSYRLRVNADDGTAIHGTARDFPWEVAVSTSTALVLTFDSREFSGVNYPWPFSATLTYQVSGRRLTIVTELCNQHDEPVPVGLGHHPYFVRALAAPDDEAQLEVPFDLHFPLERALPNGPAVPVTDRVDFRALRPLGEEFVDDCYTGRTPGAPCRIVYPRSGRTVVLGSDDAFTHAVVYVPRDAPWFAVEPVTNANDAFRLHDHGTPRSGLRHLAAGEGLRAAIWLDLED